MDSHTPQTTVSRPYMTPGEGGNKKTSVVQRFPVMYYIYDLDELLKL